MVNLSYVLFVHPHICTPTPVDTNARKKTGQLLPEYRLPLIVHLCRTSKTYPTCLHSSEQI